LDVGINSIRRSAMPLVVEESAFAIRPRKVLMRFDEGCGELGLTNREEQIDVESIDEALG